MDDAEMELEVWPENWDTWQVWLAARNQWSLVAWLGGVAYQGLDHQRVKSTMTLMGIKKKARRRVFEGLDLMETEALPILNAAE